MLKGGEVQRTTIAKPEVVEVIRDIPKEILEKGTYGTRATSPILGKFFKLPPKVTAPSRLPTLDSSLPHVSKTSLQIYP